MRYGDLQVRRLNADNFVVERLKYVKSGDNEGETYTKILGYYPDAQAACKGLTKHIVNDKLEKSFSYGNFLHQLEAISWDITRKLKELYDVSN